MALDDYGGMIAAGQSLVPDLNKQLLQRAQLGVLGAQAQQYQAAAAVQQQKVARQQQFQHAISTMDGSPDSIATIMREFPEYSDQLKASHDLQSSARQQDDLTQSGEIYAAAQSGDWKLAQKLAHARADAERARGYSDPGYDAALQVLDKAADGDTPSQKTVLNLLGTHIAATTGLEHFGTVYGQLNKDKGYTLGPGEVRFGDDNQQVASVAPKPDYLIIPQGGKAVPINGAPAVGGGQSTGGGGPASSGGAAPAMTPAVASVASTLSGAGLPAPVVAGFLGNFHVEGGYDGAQGDGGSASGIGQWHSDRAANFQKVIGKPVTEATPAEQAQFVAWEMQNPQAAGMTVAQRDAILNAKTPSQAAALIDQYYERSSGKDRNIRMSAANAFAGDNSDSVDTSKPYYPASTAHAGDPAGTLYGNPAPQVTRLTPEQAKAARLDPTQVWEQHPDGSITSIGKADSTASVPGNPDLTGPEYLADLQKNNKSLAAQVQGVLDTRLAYPPATARSPQAQQLRAAVLQADPTYDEQAYARRKTTIQQYTPGHSGPGASMLSAATLINHMYDLAQAARDLPDHTTKFQNWLSATAGSAVNAPWLIKFNEGRKFVSSELPKFLNGKAPTEGEQRDHMNSYDPSKGKSGIQTALSTDVDYLYGRYEPLIQAYKDSTGKDLNIDNYAPGTQTKAKAAALEYYRSNGALPVVVKNAAQAAKLPHGAVFATPDGRVLKRR